MLEYELRRYESTSVWRYFRTSVGLQNYECYPRKNVHTEVNLRMLICEFKTQAFMLRSPYTTIFLGILRHVYTVTILLDIYWDNPLIGTWKTFCCSVDIFRCSTVRVAEAAIKFFAPCGVLLRYGSNNLFTKVTFITVRTVQLVYDGTLESRKYLRRWK